VRELKERKLRKFHHDTLNMNCIVVNMDGVLVTVNDGIY